jgi:hypothetical protein
MPSFACAVIAAIAILSVTACGDDSSTTPSPPPSPTRIIGVAGNLAFGDVEVGATKEAQFTITNSGNTTLIITGITGPGGDAYTASWTNGAIAASASQVVGVRFAPPAEQSYNGTVTVNGDQTAGTNTIPISGRGVRPPGPRTQFGAGTWMVGTDIAPGRYYNDPRDGCYWERLSGLGGTLAEILANEFIGFDAGQWIVEILPTDRAFNTDGECGIWFNSPRGGLQATIRPGVWLVGSQISPGVYRTVANAGCYWERKRSFLGTLSDIIANDFMGSGGQALVDIRASDLGFQADDECGPAWVRQSVTDVDGGVVLEPSPSTIEMNRARYRSKIGLQ